MSFSKKTLQFGMGIPNFLTAQENFKQLLFYLYNTDFKCCSDSHIKPESPRNTEIRLRVKLAPVFPVPYICCSPE